MTSIRSEGWGVYIQLQRVTLQMYVFNIHDQKSVSFRKSLLRLWTEEYCKLKKRNYHVGRRYVITYVLEKYKDFISLGTLPMIRSNSVLKINK
jgi:hypothetical protein